MKTEVRFPIAVEFEPLNEGKSRGICVVHVVPEHAEAFDRLRERGASEVELVAVFEAEDTPLIITSDAQFLSEEARAGNE